MTTTMTPLRLFAGCWTATPQEAGSAPVDPDRWPGDTHGVASGIADALSVFAVHGRPRVRTPDTGADEPGDAPAWSVGPDTPVEDAAGDHVVVRVLPASGRIEVRGAQDGPFLDRTVADSMARAVSGRLTPTPAGAKEAEDPAPAGAGTTPPAIDVVELISRTARAYPDDRAVRVGIAPDAADVLTYRELAARAESVAHTLGVAGAADVVAVPFRRETALVVDLLGVLLSGRTYVLLSPGDSDEYTEAIVRRTAATRMPAGAAGAADPTTGVGPAQGSATDPGPGSVPTSSAYLNFTSGTTGSPKGVEVGRTALANYCAFLVDSGICGRDVLLPLLSAPGFDAIVKQLWGQLAAGGTVVIPDDEDLFLSIERALAVPGVVVNTVPAVWSGVLDHSTVADPTGRLLLGGDELTPDLVRRTRERFPGMRVTNLYGPSEFTSNATWNDSVSADRDVIPIGDPIRGTIASVVDGAGAPVPFGAVGELMLSGDGIALGYRGDGRATADVFVPDSGGRRCYATGDRVRRTTDGLVFLGRYDAESKVNGVRVDPAALAASLVGGDGITAAHVDIEGGELYVYVVLARGGGDGSGKAIRDRITGSWRRETWPADLVLVDELPSGADGEVDAVALRALRGPSGGTDADVRNDGDDGDDAASRFVEALWTAVLDRTEQGVPRGESFTELGGTSMKSLKLIAMYRRLLGVEVGLDEFRDRHTLDQHVELLSGKVEHDEFDRLLQDLAVAR